ncbi:hypothetical protein [Geosporobacter ferrireducens]|uniref:Uncharacterized protein n=1 Tax=Geosporobacter ferrireducens TaxID=1424294 RepID=A0A1D8GCD5_9FIRM|nr:hypothetical protein [Geosporobacter ferrireducens]AOT68575.1 hypothetical protein Gferi_02570 [Geosporobacter ferrireducens]MTI54043.1 ATPase [Geosporobacter ferrireducens]
MDPKYPGAVDQIINFGEFWNEEGILSNKEKIIETTARITNLFKRAYRFFAAAKSIRDDLEVIYEEALDKGKYNFASARLKAEIFGGIPYALKTIKPRHLFGSAFSPKGIVDYYETIIDGIEKVVYINGRYIRGKSLIMENILDDAVKKGLFAEVYHEPMEENNIETLVIPELKIAITSSKKYEKNNQRQVDLENYLNSKVVEENEDKIKEDEILFERLMSAGLANIYKAKREHDVLETFYVPYMKFHMIDEIRKKITEKILSYEKIEK